MKIILIILKPILSFRYSPNGNNDISSKDILLNYNNVFDLNRIGSKSQVEGGESLTLGLEFKREELRKKNILDFKIGKCIKIKENKKLTIKIKIK